MCKTTHARNVTLLDLETKFGLHLTQDIQFFPEWQTDLPEVTEQDKQAQLLAYMLASPHPERPTTSCVSTSFGMITTGGSFVFIKLTHGKSPPKEACRSPQYATSRGFELLNPGNDLYEVLAIVKRLGQL